MAKKIIHSTKETLKIGATGETLEKVKKSVYKIPQEPSYVKLYLGAIPYLCDLQERHSAVLMAILRRMPFADSPNQHISLSKLIKHEIAQEIGKSDSYVAHAISDLAKGRVLIHNDGSPRSTCYRVNPHIIARGEWKDIEELRLHVSFNAEGKTFWSEVRNCDGAAGETTIEAMLRRASEGGAA